MTIARGRVRDSIRLFLIWDLLSYAQLREAPRVLPASEDDFESQRGLLLYDLPTEHMRSKQLLRSHFSEHHQMRGCAASMNSRSHRACRHRRPIRQWASC